MNCVSKPVSAFRLMIIGLFAVAFAGTAQVGQARANNWVGPAIVGAIVGGAIAHSAYRNGYWYGPPRYRAYARYPRRRYYYPPAYYAPPAAAIVIPMPYFYFGPGW